MARSRVNLPLLQGEKQTAWQLFDYSNQVECSAHFTPLISCRMPDQNSPEDEFEINESGELLMHDVYPGE